MISKDAPYYYDKLFLDQRDLDDSLRAIFYAEALFKRGDFKPANQLGSPLNFINLSVVQSKEDFEDKIKDIEADLQCWKEIIDKKAFDSSEIYDLENTVIGKGRQDFYKVFVEKIEWKEHWATIVKDKEDCCNLKLIDKWIFNVRNNIHPEKDTDNYGHHSPGRLFRQPTPFSFWELCALLADIHTYLNHEDIQNRNKRKIFLLDNKDFRQISADDRNNKIYRINNILMKYGIDKYFHITQSTKEDESDIFVFRTDNYEHIDFSKYLLILLDFFLSSKGDRQYLAFDFIRKYCNKKDEHKQFHTDWFFIVSVAYQDVLEYANAGRLFSFSATTRVDFGDDPTNKKRDIIFLYKLLTFILARHDYYKACIRAFLECDIFFCQNNGTSTNLEKQHKDCPKGKEYEKCFKNIQTICRKYLSEHEDMVNFFPCLFREAKEDKTVTNIEEEANLFKENVELLDAIINQFFWMAEADWPIIQREIDFLNEQMKPKRLFKCSFILEELKRRSKIY
jgi:hypothetical protein